MVNAAAHRAGLPSGSYSGHSLRSGMITSAAHAPGANIFRIAALSRHKSMDVLNGYVQEANMFKDHPLQGLV